MKVLGVLSGKLGFSVKTQQQNNDSIFLYAKCIMDATFLLGCFKLKCKLLVTFSKDNFTQMH